MKWRALPIGITLLIAGTVSAQSYPFAGPDRVFSPWTASDPFNWLYSPAYFGGAAGTSNETGTTTNINVDPYVFVAGMFDESITVQGMGAGISQTAQDDFQVLTNMDLSFNFANFNAVSYIPNSSTTVPGPHAVTVAYQFEAYSNYSTGQTINPSGTVAGNLIGSDGLTVDTDTATPQSASLNMPLSSTTNGVGSFRIKRTVTLTGNAPGDANYNSIGDLVVSIN